ncbi:hypothetical protein, partial [Burkholderia ubonensis]|uniref:hypothetical protein n=1 Tax=Burkholderia ubonensis TaxID=101571 RepID=UPI001C49F980
MAAVSRQCGGRVAAAWRDFAKFLISGISGRTFVGVSVMLLNGCRQGLFTYGTRMRCHENGRS